jgi:protein-S-isoprenylcysteine O-methyltransferase Ste14
MGEISFRVVLAALLVGFVAHRGFYTRKVRHPPDSVMEQPRPGWGTRIASLLAVPALAAATAYVLAPGWVSWAALPLPAWLRWAGIGIALAGFTLLQWSHRALGNNWSDAPRLVADQELVAAGPYRWVRHPIYVAFLLILGPLGLISANWLVGGAWLAMTGLGVACRIRTEEALMVGRFGDRYRAYMRRTGRLFPRIVPGPGAER